MLDEWVAMPRRMVMDKNIPMLARWMIVLILMKASQPDHDEYLFHKERTVVRHVEHGSALLPLNTVARGLRTDRTLLDDVLNKIILTKPFGIEITRQAGRYGVIVTVKNIDQYIKYIGHSENPTNSPS